MDEPSILRRNALLDEWHTPAAKMQREQWKRMTPVERIYCMEALWQETRMIMRAGIIYQHPDWDEGQILREIRRRTLPKALWQRYEQWLEEQHDRSTIR